MPPANDPMSLAQTGLTSPTGVGGRWGLGFKTHWVQLTNKQKTIYWSVTLYEMIVTLCIKESQYLQSKIW